MSIPPSELAIKRNALRAAVDDHADVEFLGDVGAFFDEKAAHLLPARTGLMGHELHAENLPGALAHLVNGARELHPAALAAPAGVNLRFDHPDRATERLGCRYGFFHTKTRQAAWSRQAEFAEEFLPLIFVDLHGSLPG